MASSPSEAPQRISLKTEPGLSAMGMAAAARGNTAASPRSAAKKPIWGHEPPAFRASPASPSSQGKRVELAHEPPPASFPSNLGGGGGSDHPPSPRSAMMSQLNSSSYAGGGTPPPQQQQLAGGGGITRSAQFSKPPAHQHHVAFQLPRQVEYNDSRSPYSGSAPPVHQSPPTLTGGGSLRGSIDGGGQHAHSMTGSMDAGGRYVQRASTQGGGVPLFPPESAAAGPGSTYIKDLLEGRVKLLQEDNQMLRENIRREQQAREDIARLMREECASMAQKLREEETRNFQMETELSRVKVDLSQAHESLKSAEEALLNRDQVLKGLRTQLETSEGKLSSTRTEAEGDKARLEQIEASLRQETVRADGAKARSDKLEQFLAEEREVVKRLTSEVAQSRSENSSLKAKLESSQASAVDSKVVESIKAGMEKEHAEAVRRLNEAHAKEMNDSATKLARTQEAMASLESEHSTLEASAEAMRSNLITLTSELQRVSEGLRDTQMHAMEANVMREQIKALSSEVTELQARGASYSNARSPVPSGNSPSGGASGPPPPPPQQQQQQQQQQQMLHQGRAPPPPSPGGYGPPKHEMDGAGVDYGTLQLEQGGGARGQQQPYMQQQYMQPQRAGFKPAATFIPPNNNSAPPPPSHSNYYQSGPAVQLFPPPPHQGMLPPYNAPASAPYPGQSSMMMMGGGGGGGGGYMPYQNGMGDGGGWRRVEEEMTPDEIALAGYDPNAVIGV